MYGYTGTSVKGRRDYMNSPKGAFYLGHDNYVYKHGSSKIRGRVSGNSPGSYWYQIAAKPYDETEVMGFTTKEAALSAIVDVLVSREANTQV